LGTIKYGYVFKGAFKLVAGEPLDGNAEMQNITLSEEPEGVRRGGKGPKRRHRGG